MVFVDRCVYRLSVPKYGCVDTPTVSPTSAIVHFGAELTEKSDELGTEYGCHCVWNETS